jgi:hypothetical protein
MTAVSVPPTKCLPLFATESVEEFGLSRVRQAVQQSGGIALRTLGLTKLIPAAPFAGLKAPGRSKEGRKNRGDAVGCPVPDL